MSRHAASTLGYRGAFKALNSPDQLTSVIILINKGIDTWGISTLLDYVRGGYKAFMDHKSYRADEYRNGVATGLSLIDKMPPLMTDNRRIEMNISHQ